VTTRIDSFWPTLIYQQDFNDPPEKGAALAELCRRVFVEHSREGEPFFARRYYNLFQRYRCGLTDEIARRAFDGVRALLRDGCGDAHPYSLKLSGWVQVMKRGQAIPAHDHVGIHYVATYYVKVDESDDPPGHLYGGSLRIADPRATNQDHFPAGHFKYRYLLPHAGSLFVFPGFVKHDVPVFHGDERISIAMNIIADGGYQPDPKLKEVDLAAAI